MWLHVHGGIEIIKPCKSKGPLAVWQSSRPASFLPAGLTLRPIWLEHWLATRSRLSTQVRIPIRFKHFDETIIFRIFFCIVAISIQVWYVIGHNRHPRHCGRNDTPPWCLNKIRVLWLLPLHLTMHHNLLDFLRVLKSKDGITLTPTAFCKSGSCRWIPLSCT